MGSAKSQSYECKLCELLGEGRPESLRSTESMRALFDQISHGARSKYICLSGTHIRYIHGGWELTDGCKVTQEFYEKEETCERFNLGNCFLCMFVPRKEQSCARWLVRMMSERTTGCQNMMNVDLVVHSHMTTTTMSNSSTDVDKKMIGYMSSCTDLYRKEQSKYQFILFYKSESPLFYFSVRRMSSLFYFVSSSVQIILFFSLPCDQFILFYKSECPLFYFSVRRVTNLFYFRSSTVHYFIFQFAV